MSILKEEFSENIIDFSSLAQKLIVFLQQNKEKAFRISELSNQFGTPRMNVAVRLSTFKRKGLVLHKRPYWIYNSEADKK